MFELKPWPDNKEIIN